MNGLFFQQLKDIMGWNQINLLMEMLETGLVNDLNPGVISVNPPWNGELDSQKILALKEVIYQFDFNCQSLYFNLNIKIWPKKPILSVQFVKNLSN